MTVMESLAAFLPEPTLRPNGSFSFICPTHHNRTAFARLKKDGDVMLGCTSGCLQEEIRSLLEIDPGQLKAAVPEPETAIPDPEPEPTSEPPPKPESSRQRQPNGTVYPQAVTNGHANGHGRSIAELQRQYSEKDAEKAWERALAGAAVIIRREDPDRNRDEMIEDLAACEIPRPAHLSSEEIAGTFAWIADGAFKQIPALTQQPKPPALVIPWESFDLAVAANDAYLSRTPVIDKLCYSSAVSMITGGKHAGKSTLARWMAICVAKGMRFLQRDVVQGPVVYIASEDETMPARQELIRLGWNPNDPLKFLSASNAPTDDRIKMLEAIALDVATHQVSLVVFDMLFDFVDIKDEMSYSGTREAVGRIQQVASQTNAHIVVIHHAPKNAAIGDAAVAALGSQGLAARVSPIILVRRFGPGVHSILSTGVRDPRGEMIPESRLLKHEDGSVSLGGIWKTYMLAEAYSDRVLEFVSQEEGAEVTASDVANGLMLEYEVARACLSSLWKAGAIERAGLGKKGKPFRYTAKPNT